MRLIDADKIDFNEVFVGASEFAQDTRNAAQMLIDKQPTVYDTDNSCKDCAGCMQCKCDEANAIQEYISKVVKQLEDRSTLARPVGWPKSYEIVTLEDAIEIVRGGEIS